MTICKKRFEKLYSEKHNFSTIFEKAKYGTKKNNPGKIKQAELYLAVIITIYQMKWRKYPMFSIPLPFT